MSVAHIGCGEFPFINAKMSFSPFFGDHSTSGGSNPSSKGTGPYIPPTPGPAPHHGNGGTKGFDPRLYESPPQQAPNTSPGGGKSHGHSGHTSVPAPGTGNGSPTSPTNTATG
jgi:hypothetical protein